MSVLDIPFNKYLLSIVPKPFQFVFPKVVTKHGLDPASTSVHLPGEIPLFVSNVNYTDR